MPCYSFQQLISFGYRSAKLSVKIRKKRSEKVVTVEKTITLVIASSLWQLGSKMSFGKLSVHLLTSDCCCRKQFLFPVPLPKAMFAALNELEERNGKDVSFLPDIAFGVLGF